MTKDVKDLEKEIIAAADDFSIEDDSNPGWDRRSAEGETADSIRDRRLEDRRDYEPNPRVNWTRRALYVAVFVIAAMAGAISYLAQIDVGLCK